MGVAGGSRTRDRLRATGAMSRLFRAGETPLVLLAAVWAVEIGAQGGLLEHYLEYAMPDIAWTLLFSAVAAVSLLSLWHGDIRARTVCTFISCLLWLFVGTLFTVSVDGGSVIGPTALVISLGAGVTTSKLGRLQKMWPL